jgi:hypothetical protein
MGFKTKGGVLIAVLLLAACGGSEEPEKAALADATVAPTSASPTPTGPKPKTALHPLKDSKFTSACQTTQIAVAAFKDSQAEGTRYIGQALEYLEEASTEDQFWVDQIVTERGREQFLAYCAASGVRSLN